jgi:hypothetical protein
VTEFRERTRADEPPRTGRPRTEPPRTEQPRSEQARSEWDFLNGAARGGGTRSPLPDLSQLFFVLDALRRAVPQELQDQFNSLVREVLLTIRALIDWYLERLERGPAEPKIEDIPIE